MFEVSPIPTVDSGTSDEDDDLDPGTKRLATTGAVIGVVVFLASVVAESIGAGIASVRSQPPATSKALPGWAWPVFVGGIALLVCAGLWAYWLMQKDKLREAERERKTLESAADRLRERMELPSLVDFNRVLLDKYHGIATDQATKAYRSSRFAMGIGLAILITAFFAGWRLNAQGDRLFVGSIAAVGTAFTGYLSRTYMQTYDRALQQLNQYFNQPVLNGYFLTAERIAASLPDDRRAEILERVVAEVLESGKQMHRNVTAVGPKQIRAPKPSPRRHTAADQAAVPSQRTD